MQNTENFKDIQIVYEQNVLALKQGIAKRHPNTSSKEQAAMLAGAIRQILSNNLIDFDLEMQQKLIQNLIVSALSKQSFAINVYDIIECYCKLEPLPNENLLLKWLTVTQKQNISLEQLSSTIHNFQRPTQVHISSNTPSETTLETSHETLSTTPEETTQKVSLIKELLPLNPSTTKRPSIHLKKVVCITSALLTTTFIAFAMRSPSKASEVTNVLDETLTIAKPTPTFVISEEDYLNKHLQYKEINQEALQDWLTKRNSLLAEEPYFSAIISSAASFNINPLLMFAITGQEQGFVPKTHKYAKEIANNPFNVYGSWQEFNTTIEDTSLIAARTIINLSKGCPKDADPIKWLNQKYAEDKNWHKGVSALLKQLEEVAGNN